MTPKRPKELKWIGKMLPDGRPIYFVNDVEPRDYTEQETDALTQDQLQSARSSGLYREIHGAEHGKKVVKNKATKDPDHGQAAGSDAEEVEDVPDDDQGEDDQGSDAEQLEAATPSADESAPEGDGN